MNADLISTRLASAVAELDSIADWLAGCDPETAADLGAVACGLAELKLEIERETFVQVAA